MKNEFTTHQTIADTVAALATELHVDHLEIKYDSSKSSCQTSFFVGEKQIGGFSTTK